MLYPPHIEQPPETRLQITANWDGEQVSKRASEIGHVQFFTLPFLLFSVLPEVSAKGNTVLRMWLGWQFLRADLGFNHDQLWNQLLNFRFQIFLTINDRLTAQCSLKKQLRGENFRQVHALDQYLAYHEFWSENFPDRNLNLIYQTPLLIPQKCLDAQKLNQIKLAWTPNNNSAQFFSQTSKLKVNFVLPQPLALRFNLGQDGPQRLQLPFLYLIRFPLAQTTLIDVLLHQEIELQSLIKDQYSYQQPFEGLFQISQKPIGLTSFFRKMFDQARSPLYVFFDTLFKNWIFNFRPFLLQATTQVTDFATNQAQKWTSTFQFQTTALPSEFELPKQDHYHARHSLLNQSGASAVPHITNQLHSKAVFLTSNATNNMRLQLQTRLQVATFYELELQIWQNLAFKNDWQRQLKLVPQPDASLNFQFVINYFFTFDQLKKLFNAKHWMELEIAQNQL